MSVKIMTVLAILATLCFLALVTLQVWEMTDYRKAPSVWPTVVQ